jgi:fructose transport system permease protein
LAGVASLTQTARLGAVQPSIGEGYELTVITAVVLGGTSLFGGRGSVIGTLLGALIVGIIRNGLQLMGVPSIYQTLITGVLVIGAVAVDQFNRGRQQ